MENNSARLHRILCELGDSADQVAETLKAQGILGVRNTVRMLNPIVRFVQGSLLISNIGMDLSSCRAAMTLALGSINPTSAKPRYQNATIRSARAKGQEQTNCRKSLPCLQCRREDSNLHSLNGNQVLNLARLPVPPLRQALPSS